MTIDFNVGYNLIVGDSGDYIAPEIVRFLLDAQEKLNKKMADYKIESDKAAIDMMIYGTGVMKIPNDGGDPKHIPIGDFRVG